jgi:hypothetical protein
MLFRASKKSKTEISNKVAESKKAKKVIVTLDGRALSLEFDISDEDMITSATSSLSKFVYSFLVAWPVRLFPEGHSYLFQGLRFSDEERHEPIFSWDSWLNSRASFSLVNA